MLLSMHLKFIIKGLTKLPHASLLKIKSLAVLIVLLVACASVTATASSSDSSPGEKYEIENKYLPISAKTVERREIEISEAPYQVSLQRNSGHFCGGVILSEKFILTAASCVYNVPADEDVTVHAGIGDLSLLGQSVHVVQTNIDPNYKSGSHDYDVAVLQVAPILNLGENYDAMAIKLRDYNSSHTTKLVAATGWIETDSGIKPDILQKITFNTVSWADNCENKFDITGPSLCGESCQGELGDPVVIESGSEVGYLEGIVSYTREQCIDTGAGIYTMVEWEIRTFITEVTGL